MLARSVFAFVVWGSVCVSACAGLPGLRREQQQPLVSQPRPTLAAAGRVEPRRKLEPADVQALRVSPTWARAASVLPVGARQRGSASAANMRVVVSITDHSLLVLMGRDTVFGAPVGVATGLTLVYGERSWVFKTPRGTRRVLRRLAYPLWKPPDWHYAEVAREQRLRLAPIPWGGATLSKGRRLVVRGDRVGIVLPGAGFAPLPVGEHIVFDNTLFIPPLGTVNRRIKGELGDHALDLGDGYMIHGTWDDATVGTVSTHGCIRLRAADMLWVFEHVPVGTAVTIG